MNKVYLGDSVYAEFDGFHIVLMANVGPNQQQIFLDYDVQQALIEYINNLNDQLKKENEE